MVDICSKIGSGATPRGGKEAYCEDGVSLIRSQNVLDFEFSESGLAHINNDQAQKLKNVEVRADDVLLNITGDSVARACMIEETFLPARVNQHVAIIRGERNRVLGSYLLYFLQLRKEHLLQLASAGATRNALTKGMIEQLELDLPTVSIQRKIVSVLDLIMKKIALNREINDNLYQQLDTIYRATYPYLPSDELPAGWNCVPLGMLCDSISIKHSFDKEKLVFLNTSDVENGHFLHSTYSLVQEMPGQAKKSIKTNDILYSEIRPINRHFAFVNFQADDYVVSTKLMVIRSRELDSRRLYHFLTTQDVINELQIEAESRSGTFPQIRFENIQRLPIIIAPPDIELQFTQILKDYYNMIDSNICENQQLATLRDSILPKLMSGEIDVSEVDI